MNATAKMLLVKVAKNAVNAALVTITPMITDAGDYNLHNWHGLWHVLTLIGGAVVAREVLVWMPALLKWSSTDAEPPK